MDEYKEIYFKMFNAATEAIDLIVHSKYGEAVVALGVAQKECEAIYIALGENAEKGENEP